MIDDVGRKRGQQSSERQIGGWRIVVSAWALVVICTVLFAGAEAMAGRHGGASAEGHLSRAVIPRHDTACGGPGISSATNLDRCEYPPRSEDRSAYW
jgi:hypothetical protein